MTTESISEPIVLKRDEGAIQTGRQTAQRAKGLFTVAYRAWQSLELGDVSLSRLFEIAGSNSLESLVREHIYQGSPGLKALPLAKADLLKMIELPASFTAAKTAFEALRQAPLQLDYSQYNAYKAGIFSLDGESVTLDEAALEADLTAHFVVTAQTPQQVLAYRSLTEIARLLTELQATFPHTAYPIVGPGILRRLGPSEGGGWVFDPMVVQALR